MILKKRKCTSIIIILLLLFSMSFPSIGSTSDIEGNWAQLELNKWIEYGILKGDTSGLIRPNDNITRAEFIAIVSRIFNFVDQDVNTFLDVDNKDWFYDSVTKANTAGIITGYNGMFNPNKPITRQEAAVILSKAYSLSTNNIDSSDEFSDSNEISSWSKEYVSSLYENNYITGRPGNRFAPMEYITRAETIKLIDNLTKNIIQYEGTYIKNIEGNLLVNTSNVILKDINITGDLFLTQGVGEGEVTLDGVTVSGRTIVNGGGENSIIIKDSKLNNNLIVNKKNGKVRIYAQGNSTISKTQLHSGAKLEEDTQTEGFQDIEVSIKVDNQQLSLSGNYNNIDINSNNTFIDIINGKVTNMVTKQNTTGNSIQLSSSSEVSSLEVNSSLEVIGEGTISNAIINSENVVIEKKPSTTTIADGISAIIEGETETGTVTDNTTSSGDTSAPATTLASPSLVADGTSNNVDNDIVITFVDDAAWRSGITAVKVGGTALTATTDYIVGAGTITLKPSGGNPLLTTAGTKAVTVEATGYSLASVSQDILAGAVVAANSTVALDQALATNTTSTATITAKDQYNNVVTGYQFKIDATYITADGTTVESYTVDTTAGAVEIVDQNVTAGVTDVNGQVTFTIALPANIDGNDGLNVQVVLADGTTTVGGAMSYTSLASPSLVADGTSNNVDNDILITFVDDAAWRSSITAVKVGGTALTATTDYIVGAGTITLKPSGGNPLLTTAGTKAVTVEATGYPLASVSQDILAGAVVAANSTVALDQALATNTTSTATITAKDQYNNLVTGYQFRIDATFTTADGTTVESYTVDTTAGAAEIADQNVTAGLTDVNGQVTFTIELPANIDGNDGLSVQVVLADGTTTVGGAMSYTSLASPSLVADGTSNNVDNDIVITFVDDAAWRSSITAVKVGGTVLTATTDYIVGAGTITLKPSGGNPLLTTAGTKAVTVEATGYSLASVSQDILAGAAVAANSTVALDQALATNTTSTATITAKDQYNNVVTGYQFKIDATFTTVDGTTVESYTVDTTAGAAEIADQNVTAGTTDVNGQVTFTIALPVLIDSGDGLSVQVVLNDGTTTVDVAMSYSAP